MIESRNPQAVRSGQSGFTLVEMAVALGVTAVVMLGILFLFDFNNKLTRVQANVADMQQSLRIAQYDMVRMARMAGRGGLTLNQGVVITTADEGANARLIPGDDTSPKVLAGTDVLTLRGVFSTPIFQISFTDPRSLRLTPTGGVVEICKLSPTGQVQDLDSIKDQLNYKEAHKEAVILVSPLDDRFYKVVELDPNQTSVDTEASMVTQTCPKTGPAPGGITLAFKIVDKYDALSAVPSANAQLALEKVGYVGILEEYRFYVREDYAIAGKPESGLTPVLSRARLYPGSKTPYVSPDNPSEDNLSQDIAEGVVDLQMALGFDVNGDGDVVERLDRPGEDEWQGNAPGEAALGGGFKDLRISTLVRTHRPDNAYEAPALPRVEDHVYSLTDAQDRLNGTTARKYRRRLLQTIVNLRNLTT